jgi:hypothetical protein
MAHPQRIDVSLQPHSDPVWARVRNEAEVVVRRGQRRAGGNDRIEFQWPDLLARGVHADAGDLKQAQRVYPRD